MFKKMVKRQYPPRLWELRAYPGSGKSTFAAQMRCPQVVVDADQRFTEVLHLASGEVFALGDSPEDNTNPGRIAECLERDMPGSGVRTITVDSLTTIIAPLVTAAIQSNDAGENKNRMTAFKEKALAMRQLQDAVTKWGCDVLWIYHLQDSRDGKAQEVTRSTISDTELARLMRSINLKLEIVQDGRRRGIKVIWARRGRSGMVIWDDTGAWIGMPEMIESAVYDGLTLEDQERLERGEPVVFPSVEIALAWAVERGAFESEVHARNAYDKIKREEKPASAREMATRWIEEVRVRIKELGVKSDASNVKRETSNADLADSTDDADLEGEDAQEEQDDGVDLLQRVELDENGMAVEQDDDLSQWFPREEDGTADCADSADDADGKAGNVKGEAEEAGKVPEASNVKRETSEAGNVKRQTSEAPERPYSPEVLKAKLAARGGHYRVQVSERQRGLVAMLMEKALGGETPDVARKRRYACLTWMFGTESLASVEDGVIMAMLQDWLKPQGEGKSYHADPVAITELLAVYRAAIVADTRRYCAERGLASLAPSQQ